MYQVGKDIGATDADGTTQKQQQKVDLFAAYLFCVPGGPEPPGSLLVHLCSRRRTCIVHACNNWASAY